MRVSEYLTVFPIFNQENGTVEYWSDLKGDLITETALKQDFIVQYFIEVRTTL